MSLIDEYIEYCKDRNLSEFTVKEYRHRYGKLERFIQAKIGFDSLSESMFIKQAPKYLKEYVDGLKAESISDSAYNTAVSFLRSFFKFLAEVKKLYAVNPASGIHTVKIARVNPQALTVDEQQRLLNTVSVDTLNCNRDYAMVLLCLICGLRVGEVSKINLEDFYENDGVWLVIRGKGNRERHIPIPEICESAIDEYLSVRSEYSPELGETALFLSRFHRRISPDAVQSVVRNAMDKAGISDNFKHCSPTLLRHTAATTLMNNGADVRTIKSLLGHSSIGSTMHYLRYDEESLTDAMQRNPFVEV